ncbi:unnamed protein product [Arabidopsis lyrata]|uniref:Uncharacterized protein n=1 Tax=Arabidopsis lyrata subsp. lyrata TaxID=81972 RepID=D7KBN6_ARALL|nr:uncharacterized protein LOC9326781 [Arabidopsis lyrata subsp. lyrata]EFH66978.1 hypothetical protein ARALYDRAFT_472926 [Arabidopsis lyrata subsp. lyrata]CAH8253656.1 unnamed protein product [Arabidopsis lyrata]|eukprot:XP_002890719.1 uncharacterized protein LOC9326781 [Arabidopsis lyrata subsp. lyrata]
MESSEDVENLSRAIEKLLIEKRKREASGDAFIEDDDDQLLLSRLISQLESPKSKEKAGVITKEEEESAPSKGKREGQRQLEESIEELAKDIKKVKKQNTITHVLLSAVIILTLTWQLSEYSMIFMLKDRISHPVRSIGGMLNGMFKGKLRPIKNQLAGTSNSNDQNNHGNGTQIGPQLQVPELLREFGFDDDE